MKVLHIIPSVATVRGGPSQAVLEMVKALNNLNIEAEIATTNDNGTELLNVPLGKCTDYQQVPVWFFSRFSPPIHPLREFAFSRELTIWLWQNIRNYDLLHIHAIFSYSSTIAMAIARIQKIPYIIRPLGQLCTWSLKQSAMKKQLYLRIIEKSNLNHSQSIHFTSEAEQQEASLLNLTSSSFVLPHGLSIPAIIPNAYQRLRQQFNLPVDEPIILFLSRLHPKKGLDYLIPALGKISHHRFTFILAGSGEPDYENEIKSLLVSEGIENRTHFTGFVQGETKDLLMQGADLFALTSYSENFGISVIESLAAGTPVIITPGVALSDIVAQQQIGYVAQLDVDEIATAIQHFLDQPQESKNMGDSYGALVPSGTLCERYRARQFILDNYTWDSIASRMISVYKDLLLKISI